METIGKPIEIKINKQDQHIDETNAQVCFIINQIF